MSATLTAPDDRPEETATHLEALRQAMSARGFTTRVVQPVTGDPYVRVVNMDVGQLAEDVRVGYYNGELCYLYSWGQPSAPVRHLDSAAERLAYVLTPERAVGR